MSSDPTRPRIGLDPIKRRENEMNMQQAQITSNSWPCCLNCIEWRKHKDKKTGELVHDGCGKYEMMPPPDVILIGCVEYDPDIPF